jgi:predicted DNA-binding transcriptional regulator AlpA
MKAKTKPSFPVFYLTAREVAARYNFSVSTVWRHLRNGHLPRPYRFGGNTRWKLLDLEAFELEQLEASVR